MTQAVAFIGIDPGISGAVAVVSPDGFLDWAQRTPVVKDKGKAHYDVPLMRRAITESVRDVSRIIVGIEKVGAMPTDGRVGAFNFGKGYGIWLGILSTLDVPYIEITPQRWQAKMLAGHPRGPQTKTSAVTCAKAMFPTIPISVKADWGIADAALIAEYTRRINIGGK